MGIPFDDVQKQRVLGMIRNGATLAYAASQCGFSPATVRKHIREDREFAQAVTDAVQVGDGEIQMKLRKEILEQKSIGGMFKWMERREPGDWGEKKLVVNQHVGPGGGPIQHAIATTDQLRELLSDPEYRDKTLAMVRDLPMIEATATEDD